MVVTELMGERGYDDQWKGQPIHAYIIIIGLAGQVLARKRVPFHHSTTAIKKHTTTILTHHHHHNNRLACLLPSSLVLPKFFKLCGKPAWKTSSFFVLAVVHTHHTISLSNPAHTPRSEHTNTPRTGSGWFSFFSFPWASSNTKRETASSTRRLAWISKD